MKQTALLLSFTALAILTAKAAINVPGTTGPGADSDGALTITADTVIDLSKASTGAWNADNAANSGHGVYDPEKWAVVFKYSNVTIGKDATVRFKNHATRAPVVWLVSGNVTIEGTVDLSGQSMRTPNYDPVTNPTGGQLAEPGPGGHRGGGGGVGGNTLWAAGFGPGGGRAGAWGVNWSAAIGGSSGGYGTDAGRIGFSVAPGIAYGNPSLVPLVGGSGGAGGGADGLSFSTSGGGGGGAILIACSGRVLIASKGLLQARGGDAARDIASSGAGSGGGIRIVCDSLDGSGSLSAVGGTNTGNRGWDSLAGDGRIRIERVANEGEVMVAPAPSVVDLQPGATALLWPPAGAPKAAVVSVNAVAAPQDPKASFGATTPDVALPLVETAEVIVETENVEEASKVIVRITPRNGMVVNSVDANGNPTTQNRVDATEVVAAVKEVVSTEPLKVRWTATVPTLPGYSAIQARVIRP